MSEPINDVANTTPAGEQVRVTGTVAWLGEVSHWGEVGRRVAGPWRFPFFVQFLMVLASLIPAMAVVVALESVDVLYKILIVLLYVFLPAWALRAVARLHRRKVAERWEARGVPREVEVTYSVTDKGFIVSMEAASYSAEWSSIHEVGRNKKCLLLMMGPTAHCVPRHFFPTETLERAFTLAVLEHVGVEARKRSWQAEKFVLDDKKPG